MMLYLVYAVLIYMLFDNYKVFSSAQKSFKGMDPLLIKSVLVIVGVYSIDLTVKKFVIEPFNVQEEVQDAQDAVGGIVNRVRDALSGVLPNFR